MSDRTGTPTSRWWQGQMVTCWHPDSPGGRVTVWRPWWRKTKAFATIAEVLRSYRPTLDVTQHPEWLRP